MNALNYLIQAREALAAEIKSAAASDCEFTDAKVRELRIQLDAFEKLFATAKAGGQ